MAQQSKNRTHPVTSLIPKLIEAGMTGNKQQLELLSIRAIRVLKADEPELATDISSIIANVGTSAGALRWRNSEPAPSDEDAGFQLVKIDTSEVASPILEIDVQKRLEIFLQERREAQLLIQEGYFPPRSVLLTGHPGTGKTLIARWIAQSLGLRLVVLDLATAISSYLGKTGLNLRRTLDYARATPCVLLLDEFDAIAKKRDDSTDVGELNRIVNVLLKELEDWPLHTILIGATNHPEILDRAIHRRFDVHLDVPLPGPTARELILLRSCGHFAANLPPSAIQILTQLTAGYSGSNIETMSRAAVRRHILSKETILLAIVTEIAAKSTDQLSKKDTNALIQLLKKDSDLSVRDLAGIFGKSASTIHYHLTKERDDG